MKETILMIELKPKCKKDKPYALSSLGYLLPCCWCDKRLSASDEQEGWKKFKDPALHIDKVESVEEILESKVWQEFWRVLEEEPDNAPPTCKRYCSTEHNISNQIQYEKNNL